MSRDFDLIVYGATGATGRQAAAYLARHAPAGLRWAVAGRDRSRLEALGLTVPVLVADARDPRLLDELAARTRLVCNMAGPFRLYGDLLVDACVRNGAHYCDISGETARIRDLIDRTHDEAVARQLWIVPFCGASSVPADVLANILGDRLGDGARIKLALRMTGGRFGSGTIASIGEAVSSGDATREKDPFLLGPQGRPPEPMERDTNGIHYDRDLRSWTIFSPLGVSDTRAVRLSAVLAGRDVVVQEYLAFDSLGRAAATWSALGGFRAALRWRASRGLLAKLAAAGDEADEGPGNDSYDLHAIGTATDGRRMDVRLHAAGDAGNRVTVLCVCACALALTLDAATLPERFGVLTPAVAMGEALVSRLRATGMNIRLDERAAL